MKTRTAEILKKTLAIALALAMAASFAACGEKKEAAETGEKLYKIGICNYVDDASLNQIVENIQLQLEAKSKELGFKYEVDYDNCNADSAVLNQIISNFIADKVDLMIGVATPVVMAMQAATEDNNIPVIFAAVSDPVGCDIVESLNAPGANISGTSDYLDTTAVMNLITAINKDIDKVALFYDLGQDASKTAIDQAKKILKEKNIAYNDFTASNTSEAVLAAQAIIDGGYKAVFTPQDNTIMTAELSVYEMFSQAGVMHFGGADSFALNGAFIGYGVDYINLGKETANMAVEVLVGGKDIATTAVKTFDNGIAVVNEDFCKENSISFDDIKAAISSLCTEVKAIATAESF